MSRSQLPGNYSRTGGEDRDSEAVGDGQEGGMSEMTASVWASQRETEYCECGQLGVGESNEFSSFFKLPQRMSDGALVL